MGRINGRNFMATSGNAKAAAWLARKGSPEVQLRRTEKVRKSGRSGGGSKSAHRVAGQWLQLGRFDELQHGRVDGRHIGRQALHAERHDRSRFDAWQSASCCSAGVEFESNAGTGPGGGRSVSRGGQTEKCEPRHTCRCGPGLPRTASARRRATERPSRFPAGECDYCGRAEACQSDELAAIFFMGRVCRSVGLGGRLFATSSRGSLSRQVLASHHSSEHEQCP